MSTSYLKHLASSALEVVFPPRCVGCEAYLEDDEGIACNQCDPTIERVTSPRCPTCALPRTPSPGFEHSGIDERCRHCRTDPPHQAATHSCWLYRGAIADAIQRAKYGESLWRLRALGDALTPWFHARCDAITSSTEGDRTSDSDLGLVPVPMHEHELRERGFNAAALLLRRCLRGTDRAIGWNTIAKTEQTPSQAGLTRGERLSNVRGVFDVSASRPLERSTWIVFDDIMTTGATASEVAGTLLDAGAEHVVVLTAARAVWD